MPAEFARKLRKAQANDLFMVTTLEKVEGVVKPLARLGVEAAISGDMMLFQHEQSERYLAHFVLTEVFQQQE